MHAVDHLRGIGVESIRNEQGGRQRRRGDAEAHRHLLQGARDRARHAGLAFRDVGVDESVHAGVLQRGDEPEAESLDHDQPHGRAETDGGEEADEQAEQHRVRQQHPAVAEARQDERHRHLQAHRRQGLRHDQQPRLDRREAEPHLVEEWKQERRPARAQARDEAADDRAAEGADTEQVQAQQRALRRGRVASVSQEQHDRERQKPDHLAPAQ